MTNVLTRKVEGTGFSILDAVGVALVKQVEERMLQRFIGNGTILSGVVKAVLGGVLAGAVKGRIGGIIGTAFIVDGGEDLITAFLGGTASQSVTNNGGTTGGVRVL